MKTNFWRNIHFGWVVFWCGLSQMFIHFYETSILPRARSSIHPVLTIILVLNLYCGMELIEFHPPNSSDDLCLLSDSSSMPQTLVMQTAAFGRVQTGAYSPYCDVISKQLSPTCSNTTVTAAIRSSCHGQAGI